MTQFSEKQETSLIHHDSPIEIEAWLSAFVETHDNNGKLYYRAERGKTPVFKRGMRAPFLLRGEVWLYR